MNVGRTLQRRCQVYISRAAGLRCWIRSPLGVCFSCLARGERTVTFPKIAVAQGVCVRPSAPPFGAMNAETILLSFSAFILFAGGGLVFGQFISECLQSERLGR